MTSQMTKLKRKRGIDPRKQESAVTHRSGEERWNKATAAVVKVKRRRHHSQATPPVLERRTPPCLSLDGLGVTIHTCEKCQGHNIDMCQKQIRGGDEPMTCFLTCQGCGHRWTEN